MALKDIDKIIRADRYTQDGRDEVCKAIEKETEDKKYNIGEISQKTGLQKTANGWVEPKKGKAPGAKTGPGKSPKNVHGAEVDKIYERQLKRIKELKAKGFTDEQIDNDKIIKQTKEDMKNVGKKPGAKKENLTRTFKFKSGAGKAESKPGTDYPLLKKEDHVKLAKEVISNTMPGGSEWSAEDIAKEWKLGKADAEEVKKAMQAVKIDEANKKLEARRAQAQKIQKGVENYLSKKNGKQLGEKKPTENKSNAMPKVNGPDMAVRNFENKGEKVTNWNGTKNGFLISTTKGDYQYVEKADGSFELMDRPNVTQGEALLQSLKAHGDNAESQPETKSKSTSDCAPRKLTGDCKVKVRKG